MNKAELVDALAEHFGGNKAEATRALNAVLKTIIFKTATEGRVTILGLPPSTQVEDLLAEVDRDPNAIFWG